MRVLKMPITNRYGAVTKRSHSQAVTDQKGNLTPLHLQILQWVECRRPGDTRPKIDGLSIFAIDTAVAELVLLDLVKAVSVPQTRYVRAHWEPTGLTAAGWRTLMRHRRSQPRPVTHSWWPLRLWG